MTRPSAWRDESHDYNDLLDRVRRLEMALFASQPSSSAADLPNAPSGGRDFYYQLPTGGVWHFKFNANTGVWDFVGGPPVVVKVNSNESVTADSTWRDSVTVGPSFIAPWTGNYVVTLSVQGYASVASTIAAGVGVGAFSIPADSDLLRAIEYVGASQWASLQVSDDIVDLSAGDEIRSRYWCDGGGGQTATFGSRRLLVTPTFVVS